MPVTRNLFGQNKIIKSLALSLEQIEAKFSKELCCQVDLVKASVECLNAAKEKLKKLDKLTVGAGEGYQAPITFNYEGVFLGIG